MRFAYELIEAAPPLAWVAVYQPERNAFEVLHGCHVETHPHFFIEGAWSGEFEKGHFQDSDTVFGSGGCLSDTFATFVSCTATTDFLYHNDDTEHFAVSNSLPMLLAFLEDDLLAGYENYSQINLSILDGIRQYQAFVPTSKGHVRRVMHSNVQFRSDHITLVDKPPTPDFQTFEEYRDFLRSRVGSLLANARHLTRQNPMQVFSTQSRGYDSTAVNALAAPFGIDNIFTSPESKETGSFYQGRKSKNPSDDGTAICDVLRLPCTTIDRRGFEKTLLTSEKYYWAGLNNNQDFNLHEITAYVSKPTLLLTGQYGEYWYTRDITGESRMHYFDDELKKWDLAGHGLSEIRLKTGFVQASIPIIGSRRRPAILSITESKEMAPWRLNTRYDRPIPRRIAEEAGVPRDYFGQTKLASVVDLPSPNVPITPALRSEFFQYLFQNRLLGRTTIWLLPIAQRLNNWIYWKKPNRYLNNWRKYPLPTFVNFCCARFLGRPIRIRMILTRLDSFLYVFCVNKVRNEYAGLLARPQTATDPNDRSRPETFIRAWQTKPLKAPSPVG